MKQSIDAIDLWVERGGSGSPTLLLCHGVGCTGGVWNGLVEILERNWPGNWVVPDLRGHGRSDHAAEYSVGHHAADMASLLREAGDVVICGHSMGGLVAMLLASGTYGISVTHAISIGTKISFTDEERAQMIKLSQTPTRWFDTRDEAIERFLRVSGLVGLIDLDSDVAVYGVAEQDGRFRLAADMRTSSVVSSTFTGEIHASARAHTKIVVAAGTKDAMVPIQQLRELDPQAVELTGLGHNAHVEDPEAVWNLIADTIGMNHG